MRTISDSHDGLDKAVNLNGVHAYQKMIRAHELPAEPLLFDDAERIGPRAELAVRHAPGKRGFPDGPHEFYCEPHAQATEGGGCFGFLMTRAGSVKKKNLGNKPRHRPISCS
jgi:hypothetical protein